MKKLIEKIDAVVEGRSFFLLLGIILFCGLILRVAYLDADPPVGITKSQDFSTDPFQYNYFAQNSVDQGNPNPYGDPRFAQWQSSSQNLLAWLVFTLFGTGRAEGNAVAVIFNLASILLLALALKNFGSRLAALFFAVLACFDFTLIWFGRTPFLEGAQNFWICLAVFFFSKGGAKSLFYIFAGMACAAAAFFGKMIALFMAGVFAIVWLVSYLSDKESRKATLICAAKFAGGFAVTALVYLVFVYLPSRSQISGYLSEQAFGLYGAPKALESPGEFFYQLMTLLWDTQFIGKIPVATVLAFLAGAGILTWFAISAKSKKGAKELNLGWLLLVVWFGVGYLSLFPWNYRPLRYQTTIMFPAFALAGVALAALVNWAKQVRPTGKKPAAESTFNLPILATLWGLWLLPLVALAFLMIAVREQAALRDSFISTSPFVAALVFVVIAAGLALAYSTLRSVFRNSAGLGLWIAAILLVVAVGWNLKTYIGWIGMRQYSLVTADRDLGAILNKGAVITGSYATAFTQQNKHGCIIHMFGVVNVDREFFAKYPITHIAMDEGNEKFAREQYPELMDRATFVTRYYARGIPVKVYSIAEVSPNANARQYVPTDYEISQKYIAANVADSAEFYMRRYLESGVPNYSANLYVGDALNSAQIWDRAIESYRKVQEFSPGDPLSAVYMGNCFLSMGTSQSNAVLFDSALVYFEEARKLFRDDPRLNDNIKQLERRRQ